MAPQENSRVRATPTCTSIRRHDRPWMGEASLTNLSAEIRDAPEALVTVAFSRPLWLDGFDRWLQLSPPLLAARNAPVSQHCHRVGLGFPQNWPP